MESVFYLEICFWGGNWKCQRGGRGEECVKVEGGEKAVEIEH